VSSDIYESVEALNSLSLKANKIVHGRSSKSDINDAKILGIEWIGIFYGTSSLSRKYKYNVNKSNCLKQIEKAIKYAKDQGLKVRFTAEDASRTSLDFLMQVGNLVQKSGADRFSFADTVGCLTPTKIKFLISQLSNELDIPIHVHCHNDFGMATANSLSSLEGGAQCIDVSINGLGERCGIAPLSEIITALNSIYNIKSKSWNLKMIPDLTTYVEKISKYYSKMNQPIIGENAFIHKAGLHTRGVLKNPLTYEPFAPEIINRKRKIQINKFTGISTLKEKLRLLDYRLGNEDLILVLKKIKSFRNKNHWSKKELSKLIDGIK
jgi:2-isopropylmalate synthase